MTGKICLYLLSGLPGKNAREGGIGIGLALAKELIGRQNGTIRAKNLPEGGACFEIRIYRH